MLDVRSQEQGSNFDYYSTKNTTTKRLTWMYCSFTPNRQKMIPAGKLSSPSRKDGKNNPKRKSNAQRPQIAIRCIARQNNLPGHLEHTLISCFGGTFQTAHPPDPLYSHYVRNRHFSHASCWLSLHDQLKPCRRKGNMQNKLILSVVTKSVPTAKKSTQVQ